MPYIFFPDFLAIIYRFGKTFTDYLDDVSTTYATPGDLDSEIAITLANRNGELEQDGSTAHENNYIPGSKRGDDKHDDSFLMAHLGMSYVIRGTYRPTIEGRGGHVPAFRVHRVMF